MNDRDIYSISKRVILMKRHWKLITENRVGRWMAEKPPRHTPGCLFGHKYEREIIE
jgi:hypothetical protein